MIREILFPKFEEYPQFIWHRSDVSMPHTMAAIIWYWIGIGPFGLVFYWSVFANKMDFESFWIGLLLMSIFISGFLYLGAWSRERGSLSLQMDTPSMDFDSAVAMEILRRHLGSSSLLSFKDNSIIIETGANVVSLYCGEPDGFSGEWHLDSVKGEKLRLDNPMLGPLGRAISDFLNRDIPLDEEEETLESEYKGPIPGWFKEGFRVEYVESFKDRKNVTSETAIEYSIVRNRAGSLLIKCKMSDDFSIDQHVKSIDEYYDERDWWMFHMPSPEMQNKKNEIDTIIYSRTGPKRIHSPIGVFECIGFNFDGLEDCHCAAEKNTSPGTCQECKGRKYRMYFPPMRCDRCKGTGVCSSCDGKKKRYRSETYWYDSGTGFLIKWELKVSGSETDAIIQKIEPPDLLIGDH